MPALGSQMKALLAAWDDATAPLDARVRDDPLLFASQLEITASSRVKRLTGLESDESDESADVCHPWDHAEFLARVSSFSIASWFAKLDAISAFDCKQFLCFKIDDRLSGAGALKVAETFAGQLVTGHTQLCPWRGNPSPEAFTTLPIATKRQVYESFMDRLQDEVTRMYEDADFQKRLSSLKVADRVTAKILQEADSSVSSEALVNAAFLAHRHFCPWVAGRSSTGVDDYGETDPKLWEFVKLPGWKQYAQALALLGNPEQQAIVAVGSSDAAGSRASDPVQALESIRAVLGI
uniref:C3HC-type domain-containing protein n=1 Tax=Phytophthora ramorum TaxID=164328 RepID=H3GDL2_PHYRM